MRAVLIERIIPAPAGNTSLSLDRLLRWPDHPRTRGEHRSMEASRSSISGSSPHPRGTPRMLIPASGFGRIIPAPAGNTCVHRCLRPQKPDHPRTRGEHNQKGRPGERDGGSSPHPRGTRLMHAKLLCISRIIPAPAGNTPNLSESPTRMPDHPRTRGEHTPYGMPTVPMHGSSPHPRGTPAHGLRSGTGGRIIPAPAGNTTTPDRSPHACTDHPRTRGEHLSTKAANAAGSGSSPHPRGTLRGKFSCRHLSRIIPAPAGNTHRPDS